MKEADSRKRITCLLLLLASGFMITGCARPKGEAAGHKVGLEEYPVRSRAWQPTLEGACAREYAKTCQYHRMTLLDARMHSRQPL